MKRVLLAIVLLCVASNAQAQLSMNSLSQMCSIEEGRTACRMWITGFLSGMFAVQSQTKKENRVTCIPNGVNGEQAILIIEKFARDHPNITHYPATGVAYSALTRAFPCN